MDTVLILALFGALETVTALVSYYEGKKHLTYANWTPEKVATALSEHYKQGYRDGREAVTLPPMTHPIITNIGYKAPEAGRCVTWTPSLDPSVTTCIRCHNDYAYHVDSWYLRETGKSAPSEDTPCQ